MTGTKLITGLIALAAVLATGLVVAESGVSGDLAITALDIQVELQPQRGLLSETVRVTIEGSGGPVIHFRLNRGLRVEQSRVSNGIIGHHQAGQDLEVILKPVLNGERRTLTFVINGRPRRGAEDLVQHDSVVLGGDDFWYPALPAVKAVADIRITAPEDWTVLASGQPGGSDKRHFRASRPVRSLGLAAGPDLVLSSANVQATVLHVTGPVGAPAASELATLLADPMTWLSGNLRPYPFDGMTIAILPSLNRPVRASGFMAVPADLALTTRADLCDVLSGQWFGEYLAGDGAWIDSLAAWQALTYARDRAQAMPTEIGRLRDVYLKMYRNRDISLARAERDSPAAVLRGKGSAAWQMIRRTAGSRHFQSALDGLFESWNPEPLTLDDLKERFSASSPEPVEAVFSEWFERTSVPQLDVAFKATAIGSGEWRTDLRIEQTGPIYTMILDVVFHGVGQEHRRRVRLDGATTSLIQTLPFETGRVEIDPLGTIFKHPSTLRKR